MQKILFSGMLALFIISLTTLRIGAQNQSSSPSENKVYFDSTNILGGMAKTWATFDAQKKVIMLGVTLPLQSIKNAPESKDTTAKHTRFPMQYGQQIKDQTFIDHVELDWNSSGHMPFAIFGVPHYDVHFFNLSTEDVDKIDCSDQTLPDSTKLPPHWAFAPPPKGICEKQMGYHAADMTSPVFAQPPNSKPFEVMMILGYYKGEIIFYEPMFTKKFLLKETDFSIPVPTVPLVSDKSKMYPTMFKAFYNKKNKSYDLIWSNFVYVK